MIIPTEDKTYPSVTTKKQVEIRTWVNPQEAGAKQCATLGSSEMLAGAIKISRDAWAFRNFSGRPQIFRVRQKVVGF